MIPGNSGVIPRTRRKYKLLRVISHIISGYTEYIYCMHTVIAHTKIKIDHTHTFTFTEEAP